MFEIGSSLKEARRRKGLDLAAASEATKIRVRHLQALEEEHFDVLPGQTYVRGFLRSYADFLGLDGQLYVDEYSSRFWVNEDGDPRAPRKVRVRRRQHGRIELNMIVLTLVAIAGVTALVIAAWKFGGAGAGAAKKPSAGVPRVHAPRQRLAHLVVRAATGSSLVDVHAQTASGGLGRLLFHGTLERGETQTFVAPRLALTIGSPAHVLLRLNGAGPLSLHAGCPRAVVATPREITTTPSC